MTLWRSIMPSRLSKRRTTALVLITVLVAVKVLTDAEENKRDFNQEGRVVPRAHRFVGKKKVILLWHSRFWSSKEIDKECGRCEFTSRREVINSSDTAAVIFRSELIIPEDMPPRSTRRRDQLYIWSAGESAPSLFHSRKMWLFWETKYGFNMTMSYRRDSSLYHPYGTANEALDAVKKKGFAGDLKRLMALKTNLAVAFVSNCNSTWGARVRFQILQNLIQAGLKADYFGKCFSDESIPKENKRRFLDKLSKYKFLLAFENSYHCRDYITEKFYQNALGTGVVPVVWGTAKEDYEAVAPAGSFIHVEDFLSIAHLVKYLNYLDKNDTAYSEYFRWHSSGILPDKKYGKDYTYCILCKIIHGTDPLDIHDETDFVRYSGKYFLQNVSQRTIPSLYNWFYYGNSNDCLRTRLKIGANNTKIY